MTHSDTNAYRTDSVSRRGFLRASAVSVTATTALSGCFSDGETTGDAEGEYADITFYSTGGSWARNLEEAVITPFEEEFGVDVNLQTYADPNEVISAIKAGQADVDAMLMTDPPLYQGVEENIWGPLREENIPNLDRIETFQPDEAPYDPGEEIHHVPNTYGAYGLVYNAEEVSSEPTSWSDLYTSEFEEKLTYSQFPSSVVGSAAIELGYDLNEFVNDDAKEAEVWERVAEQNEYIHQWWDSGTTAQELFSNRSALAGNFWIGRTRALQDEDGIPVEYVLPEEGAVGYVSVWAVNADIEDPKRYTCETLLNYVLADEPSRELAEVIDYAQANEISDPPSAYEEIPDNRHPDRIHIWDQSVFQEHQQAWSNEFQEIVRG